MNISEFCIEYEKNIEPIPNAFEMEAVTICLCSSNAYAPYCGITIQSIVCNSSPENTYDIFVMESDMTNRNKKLILSLVEDKNNFSIRFVNMKKAMHDIKIGTWAHFSPVACFKLFLFSDMFLKYKKVLAVDTDLIFLKDAKLLYSTNVSDYYMAATDDVIMKQHIINNKKTSGFAPIMPVTKYLEDYLRMGSSQRYYNTGVVLFNLEQCRVSDFLNVAIWKLKSKGYTYQEQDVLNELAANQVLDLNLNWNLIGTEQSENILQILPCDIRQQYQDALDDPYIIHFAGGQKPWTHNNVPYGEYFFKYAKLTPWYEPILANITLNYTNYIRNEIYRANANMVSFRTKFKKKMDILFPPGSYRRKLIKRMFPRGRGIREWLRVNYNRFIEGTPNNSQKGQRQKELYRLRKIYFSAIKKPLRTNEVILDSKNGTDLAGNILRLLIELSSGNYGKLNLYLAYQKNNEERIAAILKRYNLSNVRLIEWRSREYFNHLGCAKYVVTDLYIANEYIKREGQVLISTAHGTPIKVMGRDCHTETQGHLQRTHTLADFQIFPSAYMKERLFGAFMEDALFTGAALKSGYCRNDVFFDKERRAVVREELKFTGKIVYAYLPTFRGIAGSFRSQEQNAEVTKMCQYLDESLPDNYILLVKMHNFNTLDMDFSMFTHIRKFPEDYEVYDVLNATDGLISDYSSVFFDYANSRNKIILFQYDLEKYIEERGVYLNWNELPFPVVTNVEDLCLEMTTAKKYDDSGFLQEYCTYDNPVSSQLVCRTIFKGENCCERFTPAQKKKNILIHIGNMDLRCPTTFFVQEYLNRIDTKKYNYILYFYEYDLFNRAHILETIPPDVQYISYLGYPDFTKHEQYLFRKRQIGKLQRTFQRECQRCFSGLPIDLFIDLSGRVPHVSEIAKNLSCKKVIVRYDEDSGISEECYQKYDVVVPIREATETENEKNEKYKFVFEYDADTLDKNAKTLEEISLL